MDNIHSNKTRMLLIPFLILCIISAIYFGGKKWNQKILWQGTPLLEYDMDILLPLLGGAEGNNLDAKDALRICPSLIRKLRYGSSDQWEECYAPIEQLMTKYYEYGYLPRDPYPGLGDYVTAMDAPLLAVTAELAYERSGDEIYYQYVKDLIPYLTQDTEHGGYVLKIDDTHWWPLEYAWKDVTDEDAWYVYNGSLFSSVCIRMLFELTKDPSLGELADKTLNAYKLKSDSFLYPDGTWCYYGLNYLDGSPMINRNEKLLIEISALESLYQLTGEPFYSKEKECRMAMLEKELPVYIVQDEKDSSCKAYLLRACAPHPYYVDIYASTIEYLDADGNIIKKAEVESHAVDGSYLAEDVPDTVASYRLYSRTNPIEDMLIVEAPVQFMSQYELDSRMQETAAAGIWSFSGDSVSMQDQILTIAPDHSEELKAILYYTFDQTIPFSEEMYIAIELENLSEETYSTSLALLNNENGSFMGRVGLPVTPGKSLGLYHCIGFKNYSAEMSSMDVLQYQIITNKMEKPEANVRVGNVYIFRSTAEVVEYLKDHSYTDYWTEE